MNTIRCGLLAVMFLAFCAADGDAWKLALQVIVICLTLLFILPGDCEDGTQEE